MKTLLQAIKQTIENCIDQKKEIAIYPMGEIGIQTKMVMKEVYDIAPDYIFDNSICKYNKNVLPITAVNDEKFKNIVIIFTLRSDNFYYTELISQLKKYNVDFVEIEGYRHENKNIGRHTEGYIVDCPYVESIGNFCSFAEGSDVVLNHTSQLLSIAPFMYANKEINPELLDDFEDLKNTKYYIKGIIPKGEVPKLSKSKIGNDVWFGKNVIVTNGSNIGNGVVAAAGAVITKDVPDYAIVGGVPAKIIKYRYEKHQIEALNRIAWWDWSDEDIATRYDDFFLPIDEFIKKYDK